MSLKALLRTSWIFQHQLEVAIDVDLRTVMSMLAFSLPEASGMRWKRGMVGVT